MWGRIKRKKLLSAQVLKKQAATKAPAPELTITDWLILYRKEIISGCCNGTLGKSIKEKVP